MTPSSRLIVLAMLAAVLLGHRSGRAGTDTAQTPFARAIADLSEPGGSFDTDNLISNERSYLWVLPELARAGVRGGAYLGVGPDTNFSYIADVRPAIAFIVDIRRDNLLLHLLFKALFAASPDRAAYLAHLVGRAPPAAADANRPAPTITELVAATDRAPALPAEAVETLRRRLDADIARMGVPLSNEDLRTIDRFHRTFMADGLDLQFRTTGRAPQPYYPSYRDLLLETDAEGRSGHFLASDAAFQFVKALQARDRVIPVTGDLGGRHALVAIGQRVAAEGERVSAFYASNVEFYLRRSGTLGRFVENLRALPRADHAVIIRSHFAGGGSTSEVEPIADLVR